MNIKKTMFFVLALTLLLNLISVTSFAAEEDEKVLYKKEEITDSDMLYQRAKNNITDSNIKSVNTQIKLENSQDIENISRYETTQLLEVKEVGESTVKTYASTLIEDIELSKDSVSIDNAVTASTYTSNTGNLADPTDSYRVYSTMYYTLTQRGGESDITIQYYRANVWWVNLDTSVQGSNYSAKAKIWGTKYSTDSFDQAEKTVYPSSDSGQSFYTGFEEYWLDDYTEVMLFTSINLTRWGNTTTFSTKYSGYLQYNTIGFSISEW